MEPDILTAKDIDNAKFLDRNLLHRKDISKKQKEHLFKLNCTLKDLEKEIRNEAFRLNDYAYNRIIDSNDWVEDYEIKCGITFLLSENDPYFDEGSDNILAILWEAPAKPTPENFNHLKNWRIGDGGNHNEALFWFNDPLKNESHCWLYHCLYDHCDIGWINILRIGKIWIDISVEYQMFQSINFDTSS